MINRVLKVHPDDNVAVALTDLHPGEIVNHEDQSYHVVSMNALIYKSASSI